MPSRPRLLIKPDALRARRLSAPLTVQELADQAGVSVQTVKALEAPQPRGVTVEILRKLASALECDTGDISSVEAEEVVA